MSIQNMDKHLETLRVCCRLCAKKLIKRERKTKAQHLQQQIFTLWGQNVHLDSPDVQLAGENKLVVRNK